LRDEALSIEKVVRYFGSKYVLIHLFYSRLERSDAYRINARAGKKNISGKLLNKMDLSNCELAAQLVSKTYIDQGCQALVRRKKLVKSLLSQRRLPEQGWDEETIQLFLNDLALMDSNNFVDNVGLGEREGRVACSLVRRRNYGFSHGIGRSGELSAEQPKAAGSSLVAKLTNHLVRDACSLAGFGDVGNALTVPVSTGMALVLSLMAVRSERPSAKYVLWSRIDQKTCIKCIPAAGYSPIVIPLRLVEDHLETDVTLMDSEIHRIGANNIACVLSTTSCFAPRAPDDVVSISKLCQKHGIPHIINNAYGVQSREVCERITSAWRKGRVDVVVQSTDKNFMVPVGGSILLSSSSGSMVRFRPFASFLYNNVNTSIIIISLMYNM